KAMASVSLRKDNAVILWDTVTGKELRRFTGHKEYCVTLAFAPDGKTLAAGAADGTVRVWDAATGKELHHFGKGGWQLTYSPDSKLLAAGQTKGIALWDLATGKSVRRLEGYQAVAAEIAFSPDGTLLAAALPEDRTIRLWEVATGKPWPPLRGHK